MMHGQQNVKFYYTVTNKPNFVNFAADVKTKQTDRQPNKTSLYMSIS